VLKAKMVTDTVNQITIADRGPNRRESMTRRTKAGTVDATESTVMTRRV
jgi:hypothetical protein